MYDKDDSMYVSGALGLSIYPKISNKLNNRTAEFI